MRRQVIDITWFPFDGDAPCRRPRPSTIFESLVTLAVLLCGIIWILSK